MAPFETIIYRSGRISLSMSKCPNMAILPLLGRLCKITDKNYPRPLYAKLLLNSYHVHPLFLDFMPKPEPFCWEMKFVNILNVISVNSDPHVL